MVFSKKQAKFSEVMPNELRRETVKKNANSEGDELSIYSEVWCRSEGRRRHTFRSERAAQCHRVKHSNGDDRKVSSEKR